MTPAPFKLGNRVKVAEFTDGEGDPSFLGQVGVVSAASVFCDDWFFTVRFPNGQKDGFWPEELEDAP